MLYSVLSLRGAIDQEYVSAVSRERRAETTFPAEAAKWRSVGRASVESPANVKTGGPRRAAAARYASSPQIPLTLSPSLSLSPPLFFPLTWPLLLLTDSLGNQWHQCPFVSSCVRFKSFHISEGFRLIDLLDRFLWKCKMLFTTKLFSMFFSLCVFWSLDHEWLFWPLRGLENNPPLIKSFWGLFRCPTWIFATNPNTQSMTDFEFLTHKNISPLSAATCYSVGCRIFTWGLFLKYPVCQILLDFCCFH